MPVFKPRTRLWGSCLLAASVLPLSCGAMAAPTAAATDTGAKASEAVPYTALADMLENEATRNQLIQVLRDQAQKKTAPAETRVSAAASLPRRAAEATQAVAEKLAARVSATMAALTFAGGDQAGPAFDAGALLAGLVRFLLVAVTTVVLWFILRLLIRPVFARAGRWAGNGETGLSIAIHRISAIAISFVVDVGVVVLACAAGYAVGLFVVGDNQGVIGTRESLFINAFAMIEIVKAIIRTLLPAHYEGLRLFPVSDTVAAWWSARLRWFTGFIGYGLLVVVPIANAVVTPGLGLLLNLLIMLVAYIYALRVIVKNRVLLRERLEQSARAQGGVMEVLLRIAARTWHLVAIAYFTVVFVVTQLRPEDALPFLVAATVQSLIAIAIAAALTGMLDKAVGSRVRLPGRLRQRLPHLEWRLNTNMPRTLHGLRLVIILVAVLALLDFWEIFNLGAWIASDAGAHAIAVTIRVLLILAVAALSWMVAMSVIEARMSGEGASSRQTTLLGLFRTALAVVIITFTTMIVLSQVGVAIGPLIAGAGVLGLAIGFGSQKLVSDVITGLFIQLDDAMNVGDIVTVASVTGTVERLGMRSTAIRQLDGTLHVVRFSSVDVVSNYMREYGNHVGEYRIAYHEDIDEAITHLRAAFEELKADPVQGGNLLAEINVAGVTSLADNSVVIRVILKAKPGLQWAVGRAYNRLVKNHFAAAGIEIPYPHRVLYFGQDKAGEAPPLRVLQHAPAD